MRSIYVSNLSSEAKVSQVHEYILRVFTRAGGLIEKTGNAVNTTNIDRFCRTTPQYELCRRRVEIDRRVHG